MTLEKYSLESKVPKRFGLDGTYIVLDKKIADLEGYEFSLPDKKGDFKKVEEKYCFELKQFFGGLNLMFEGKEKPISTVIFRNIKNHNELAILFWEEEIPCLYSIKTLEDKV